jgi:hypothetical protein
MTTATPLGRLGLVLGRSLFPVTALIVIFGALLWGPYVSLALAYLWWRIVAAVG